MSYCVFEEFKTVLTLKWVYFKRCRCFVQIWLGLRVRFMVCVKDFVWTYLLANTIYTTNWHQIQILPTNYFKYYIVQEYVLFGVWFWQVSMYLLRHELFSTIFMSIHLWSGLTRHSLNSRFLKRWKCNTLNLSSRTEKFVFRKITRTGCSLLLSSTLYINHWLTEWPEIETY